LTQEYDEDHRCTPLWSPSPSRISRLQLMILDVRPSFIFQSELKLYQLRDFEVGGDLYCHEVDGIPTISDLEIVEVYLNKFENM